MLRNTLLCGLVLWLSACDGPTARVARVTPSETRITLVGGSCPVGFIPLHAHDRDRDAARDVVTDVDGNALVPDGPGELQHLDLDACGQHADFAYATGSRNVTFRLPPSTPAVAWPTPARPSPRDAPCTFPMPAPRPFAAGSWRAVQRDPGACALWAYRDDATWLVRRDGSLLRLGPMPLT